MSKRGKYVVIEGNDGTGKSTQVQLLRKKLEKEGISSIEFHEPGGTKIADAIRSIIKDGDLLRFPETNLLLFTAARHEIWKEATAALDQGKWVVAARNYYSTLVYQGYSEGLDLSLIRSITEQFTDSTYMQPDMSVILTLDDESRKKRLSNRSLSHLTDTFERRGAVFQQKLNDGYKMVADELNIHTIDASDSPAEINKMIWQFVEPELHS